MTNHLSASQFAAIQLLASGQSVTAVAEQIKVARATVSGWLNDNPKFKLALRHAQTEIMATVIRKSGALAERATEKLEALLNSQDEKIQLQACRLAIETTLRLREFEMETRLTELENIIREKI